MRLRELTNIVGGSVVSAGGDRCKLSLGLPRLWRPANSRAEVLVSTACLMPRSGWRFSGSQQKVRTPKQPESRAVKGRPSCRIRYVC